MSTGEELDCSVVVPSYRGAHRLPRLLKRLTDQDFAGTWEVVVVLDGPDAPSQAVLDEYLDLLPLRVVVRDANGGVAAAMQTGVDAARGRIIIRCDDDLAPEPKFISTHMRHHNTGTRVGVIGATRDVFADTAYARVYGHAANQRALDNAYQRTAEQRWIGWAANNSAPKTSITSAGGFDVSLWYGEDSELGFRMHSQGLPIVVDRDLEVAHHGPANSTESRAARAFVAGASRAAFEARHPGESQGTSGSASQGFAAKAWTSAVDTLAGRVRQREGYERLGRVADVAIRVAPARVAEKIVALLVESAGQAGKASGGSDLAAFSAQKDAELARETARLNATSFARNDPRDGITIVIPHYGDPAPTQALVSALEAQRDAPPMRIIVVDDNSPNPIDSAGSAHIVYRAENGGYGSGINSGARLAEHGTLLILNSDLEIDEAFIHDLAHAAAPVMPAVVSPDIVDEHGATQWPARHFPNARQQFVSALSIFARFRGSRWWHEAVGHDTRATPGATVDVDWVVGAVMMLPTDAFRSVHGFDEGFFMNSEEVDLQRRLRQRGLPSVFLGTVRAVHESGGSSDPGLRRSWMLSSALRYAGKWGERPVRHRLALAAAAAINFPVNATRQAAGRDLDALGTLRREFGYALLPPRRVR
ncbi:glycosyltransferase family 2 protein [Pseudoclavibacter helvolus]|uniref:GT2 family glycosyltransferase n=1 Tax=Pseudoclavibacter helvolus TaxID=255205 RepID=A0A7W4UQ08_9MICO|nr:GT2 family glycosyltransferase [Pseudoclavibacter helvolus]